MIKSLFLLKKIEYMQITLKNLIYKKKKIYIYFFINIYIYAIY